MKNFLVIGNPINHSLSPKLHNYWIKQHNLKATYSKKMVEKKDLKNIIEQIRSEKINGINVTVPFKQDVINYLDSLSPEAEKTKSVNTIYRQDNLVIGHNTDIAGFELAIRHVKFNVTKKKILVIGAGGVVSSIVCGLKNLKADKICIMNRTKKKAENIKQLFANVEILEWGDVEKFDMIINATSLGLNKKDSIDINFKEVEKDTVFFDLIYNPTETNFLKKAKDLMCRYENGKMMFIYQAHQAFTLWHKIMPKIDSKTIELLDT